ncbi:ComEC/Rec2 family competence protein [Paenibacillus albidus]|uniref:ComEC/Rec2 family competence protein n=1 Tax=Paenibacillus albidus TaxID=2041023 RepID=UPI001BEB35DF|nr:ComEC/Rec2 family competence protein [Paenibacillus albidus]MBT2288176.1 ComEC/Rec2 family competence protein [Paenibacillus albidus]
MKQRPLLAFTVCWIAGNAAGCLFSGVQLLLAWAGLLLLLAVYVVYGNLSWKYTVILMLSLSLAAVYWEWNEHRNLTVLPEVLGTRADALHEAPVRAEGVIVTPVERDGDRVDFTIRLTRISPRNEAGTAGIPAGDEPDQMNLKEKLAVQLKLLEEEEIAVAAAWQRGDRVVLDGELELPSAARNFGGFDYQRYLRSLRIHWLLKSKGVDSAVVTPPVQWNPSFILRWNDKARAVLGREMDRLFQPLHSGYMKGLVIGLQDDLDPETFRQFSQLGLTHILAISGMHVAVYVGVLLWIFRRCRMTRETMLTVTLLLVPVYVLLAGAGPSVIRAGLMSMIALLAARMGMLKDGLNLLATSALVMLVSDPYMLLSVSFQLSFLVTAGLMLYVPLAEPLLCRLPRWLRSAVSVTLVAQGVSFPLTIYYFNQFSLLSFAANLLLVPFITFMILPLGMAALLLAQIWGKGATLLAQLTEQLNGLTFHLVEWINGFPAALMIWRSPSLLWIGAYYLLLYALLYAARQQTWARLTPQYTEEETRPLHGDDLPAPPESRLDWRYSRTAILLLAVGLGSLLYTGYQPEQLSGAGAISYLDVGQGDSILITTPGGAHILVDGGGTVSFGEREAWRIRRSPFEVGAKTLVPLLKKRGIHRLDAVIITHADQDHAGGLQAVLEGIPVSALLFNGTLADREPYTKLMRTALHKNVRLYAVHQGLFLAPDNATELSFLWPEPRAEETATAGIPVLEDQNHDSVVFRLEMKGHSFLFTGDMDLEAEEEIVESGRRSGLHSGPVIDVLKAAHHGSKTSTGESWLAFWKPRAAVISAGVNNLYGHPNAEVLDRLEAGSSQVFRTDRQGEIQMKVKEEGIEVRCKLDPPPGQK